MKIYGRPNSKLKIIKNFVVKQNQCCDMYRVELFYILSFYDSSLHNYDIAFIDVRGDDRRLQRTCGERFRETKTPSNQKVLRIDMFLVTLCVTASVRESYFDLIPSLEKAHNQTDFKFNCRNAWFIDVGDVHACIQSRELFAVTAVGARMMKYFKKFCYYFFFISFENFYKFIFCLTNDLLCVNVFHYHLLILMIFVLILNCFQKIHARTSGIILCRDRIDQFKNDTSMASLVKTWYYHIERCERSLYAVVWHISEEIEETEANSARYKKPFIFRGNASK